ncbi:MAG: sigma-70 family RNA polymerase sigma factor [Planctomycetia bacterium]|nr:sigma-70 family RNA polymerase sigma factor [Planctomycetia bacterium]
MSAQPAWQLERYRSFLVLQIRQLQVGPRFQSRFDSSDLVQETLLKAHQDLPEFRGQQEPELLRWLQCILANVLADHVRRARAQKRDIALEQSLQQAMQASSARLEQFLTAGQSSPSQQVERQELLLRIATALEQLQEDQRAVVIQRDLLGTPTRQIAEQLGRSEKSVAGLLLRGRRRLRELLDDCL